MSAAGRVADVIWDSLPRRVPARLVLIRLALTDGGYLRSWPVAAISTAGAALVIGVMLGWQPGNPSDYGPPKLYTYSLLGMLAMMVISFTGAGNGLRCLIGYALADLLLRNHLRATSSSDAIAIVVSYGPLLIAYVLLGVLTVLNPLVSALAGRRAVLKIRYGFVRRNGRVASAAVAGLTAGLLTWSWTHTTPTLIRPVYTWPGGNPPTDAIEPLQHFGWLLVLMAAAAAAARAVIEDAARRTGYRPPQPAAPDSATRWPLPLAVALRALVTTFVMSGLFTQVWQAVVFAVIFAAALVARAALGTRLRWVRLVTRIPVLLRLALVAVIAYGVGTVTLNAMWPSTESFAPLVISITIALALWAVLIPTASTRRVPTR
jgi:hypothetical protein